MTMVKIPFNLEMINQAIRRSKEMGSLNNSILKGEGNKTGGLSALALADFFPARIVALG